MSNACGECGSRNHSRKGHTEEGRRAIAWRIALSLRAFDEMLETECADTQMLMEWRAIRRPYRPGWQAEYPYGEKAPQ